MNRMWHSLSSSSSEDEGDTKPKEAPKPVIPQRKMPLRRVFNLEMYKPIEGPAKKILKDNPKETPEEAQKENAKEKSGEPSTATSKETSDETTTETPKNTPKETPKNTTKDTPKKTHKKTPKDTPKKTSKETRKNKPKKTSQETPKDTANQTLKETSKETRTETPKKKPKKTSKETPKDTPKKTQNQTLKDTPKAVPNEPSKEKPKKTSKVSPKQTPKKTSNEPPKDEPKKASKVSPKQTPKKISNEPPNGAPKKIPSEAPKEKIKKISGETTKEKNKKIPSEAPKEKTKQTVKEPPKEKPKKMPEEPSKERPEEKPMEMPKEPPKKTLKRAKEAPDEAPECPAAKLLRKNLMDANKKQSLPSSYRIGEATLDFMLDPTAPIRYIEQPDYTMIPLVIPNKVAPESPIPKNTKPKPKPKIGNVVQPQGKKTSDIPQVKPKNGPQPTMLIKTIEGTPMPVALNRNAELDSLLTSEEIWENFEKWKKGTKAIWPICCQQQNMLTSGRKSISEPVTPIVSKAVKKCDDLIRDKEVNYLKKRDFPNEFKRAVCLLLDWENNDQKPKKPEEGLTSLESIEMSPEDFLESQNFHVAFDEINEFDQLLSMARTEESRQKLFDLLEFMALARLNKDCKCPLKSLSDEDTKMGETKEMLGEQSVKETNSETVELADSTAIPDVNKKVQQLASKSVMDLPQKSQIEELHELQFDAEKLDNVGKPIMHTVEPIPSLAPAGKQFDEIDVQQMGLDLSLVVKSKIASLPGTSQNLCLGIKKSVPEHKLQQQLKRNEVQLPNGKTATTIGLPQLNKSKPPAVNSFKQRLEVIQNVKNPKKTENVQSQDKRGNINVVGPKNLAHLKRVVVVTPKVMDERAKLDIEVKYAKTFSTMELNLKLDLNQLTRAPDNEVYKSQILVSEILEVIKSPPLFQDRNMNTLQCHTIPRKIVIDSFCQSYALTSETIMGFCRYGYYVNKTSPRVAAKVYKSGMDHIISMTPAGIDKRLDTPTKPLPSKPNNGGFYIPILMHNKM